MAGFTPTANMMSALRTFAKERMWYPAYVADETEHAGIFSSLEITASGAIQGNFTIDSAAIDGAVVTQVKLYDRNGECWGSIDTDIDTSLSPQGLLYQIQIRIDVETE